MSVKPNVVIDTQVFIRGWCGTDKTCERIVDAVDARKVQVFFAQDTIGELMYVLKYYARHNSFSPKDTVDMLKKLAEPFYYGTTKNTLHTILSAPINDKTDEMFVKCAIEGEVDFLITEDTKSSMHGITTYPFKVVYPDEFLSITGL
jgi:putative PIN family toxin of toxin-antitoxin system